MNEPRAEKPSQSPSPKSAPDEPEKAKPNLPPRQESPKPAAEPAPSEPQQRPPVAEPARPPTDPAAEKRGPQRARDIDPEAILARSKSAVAVILGKSGSGSGFLVGPNLVATNAHVVADDLEVKVRFVSAENPEAPLLPARLLYYDRKRDLALLQVETDQAPLRLARLAALRLGQEITVIGNPVPDGGPARVNAVSKGVVDDLVLIDGLTFYQLRATVHSGNSGGPVLDALGQVVGVLTRKATDREDTAFCFSVQALHTAIEKLGDREAWDAQARKALASHGVQFVYLRIRIAGEYAAEALDARAIRRLGYSSPGSGSASDEGEVVGQFRAAHKKVRGLLNPVIEELMRSPHPDPEVDRNLHNLLMTYRQMYTMVETPSGSPADYRARAANLNDWRKYYEKLLYRQLDLPSRITVPFQSE